MRAPQLRQRIGFWLGIVLAVGLQFIAVPAYLIEITGSLEAGRHAWIALSLLLLMACWWVSEAIPIPVTSLLPLVILPLFSVKTIRATAADYFHPIVVLLLGGFIVAKAIERWNLHERIALNIVSAIGSSPDRLIAGFMLAAALLSMWISNTATSILMMPIAVSVAMAVSRGEAGNRTFMIALLLGIAYACSIGGLGTYIGTPTNLLIKDAIEGATGQEIDFTSWMMLGVPTVLVLVPLAWFVLTRWAFKLGPNDISAGQEIIQSRRSVLGALSTPEKRTIMIFICVAALWIFGRPLRAMEVGSIMPLAGLTDHVTAIFGVILCFLVPSGSKTEPGSAVLDWETAEQIPWGVVLLFGGGMALAGVVRTSGLGDWVGGELSVFADLPPIILILMVTTMVIFITEVASNIATAAALAPVLIALAGQTGIDPIMLGAPVALAASCAFMLPMATGPNAVAYATGQVDLPTMAKAGIRLNLLAIMAITLIAYVLAPLVLAG
ncbi:MAG: DASS family sodium-coupled anion symporter [Pseudomonadota bacterium]